MDEHSYFQTLFISVCYAATARLTAAIYSGYYRVDLTTSMISVVDIEGVRLR